MSLAPRHMAALALVAGLLASCAPMSPRLAAEQCQERARAAAGPQGRVAMGVGSEGMVSDFDLSISSDYVLGKDPYVLYEQCVRQKSGQGPIRPLDLTP